MCSSVCPSPNRGPTNPAPLTEAISDSLGLTNQESPSSFSYRLIWATNPTCFCPTQQHLTLLFDFSLYASL